MGLIPVTHCRVSFIFYFLFFTRKNTHQTYWKKKKNQNRPKWKKEEKEKKKNKETQNRPKWKKEEDEKKETQNSQPREERKKKVKSGQKLRSVLFVGPLYVFNYNIVIELWVMETELWKQSYYLPNNLFVMGPTIFKLWIMESENWVTETTKPNTPLMFLSDFKVLMSPGMYSRL